MRTGTDVDVAALTLERDVLRWALTPGAGVSAKTIAWRFLGWSPPGCLRGYPADTCDFGRCLRLIRQFPAARAAVTDLGKGDGLWCRRWRWFDRHWDALAVLHDDDPTWGGACNRMIREDAFFVEDGP